MGEKAFDASRYLTQLEGKDYLEVKWRLLWLRTEHPEATITTDLVEHEKGMAVFKARVSLPGGGEATGWGSENVSDFEEYIEAAETKALGRALAALGFGTQFCGDFEAAREGEQGIVADAPVARPGAARWRGKQPRQGRAATEAQINAILAIGRGQHKNEAEMVRLSQEAYGKELRQLSRLQASEFIDKLKSNEQGGD